MEHLRSLWKTVLMRKSFMQTLQWLVETLKVTLVCSPSPSWVRHIANVQVKGGKTGGYGVQLPPAMTRTNNGDSAQTKVHTIIQSDLLSN